MRNFTTGMNFGWAFLILFLVGYAGVSGAAIWHLNTYSFARGGKIVSTIFILAALILGFLSLFFFSEIDWAVLTDKAAQIQNNSI